MNPRNIANATGEKAVANFDEDSITMAVAAGLEALGGMDQWLREYISLPPLCLTKKDSMPVSYPLRLV
jgi:hypothetical protein